MNKFDVVVRDNKNKLCQFFVGISGDYENEITMNVAEIQNFVEDINVHSLDITKNYQETFKNLGFQSNNNLYRNLLEKIGK